jgi:hypothetical protein
MRAAPRDEQDLSIAAKNGWIIALDNLSSLQQWKSDALCRLSTGGGFATRQLYSDDDETIFDATRPILLNGIEDVATRPDLLDRTIILKLPQITDEKRFDEEEFWKRFEAARPQILGALMNGVASALENLSSVKLQALPRMADFAKWGAAAEPALNVPPESFINAYLKNRSKANEWALEASPVASVLISIMTKRGGRTWTVTLKDLLDSLNEEFGDWKRPDDWPKTSRGLAGALTRCAPNLRKAGWDVTETEREGGSGRARRTIAKIEDSCQSSSQTSQSLAGSENGHENREDDREVQEEYSSSSLHEKANQNSLCAGSVICEDKIHARSDDGEAFAELSDFFSEASQEESQPVITEIVTDDEGNRYDF